MTYNLFTKHTMLWVTILWFLLRAVLTNHVMVAGNRNPDQYPSQFIQNVPVVYQGNLPVQNPAISLAQKANPVSKL